MSKALDDTVMAKRVKGVCPGNNAAVWKGAYTPRLPEHLVIFVHRDKRRCAAALASMIPFESVFW